MIQGDSESVLLAVRSGTALDSSELPYSYTASSRSMSVRRPLINTH
jgi:hypothetical protein